MIKVYIDASTKGNPGPSGGGIVIIGDNNLYIQHGFELEYDLSNHEAEFAVLSYALSYLIQTKMTYELVTIYTDSKILSQTIEKNHTNNPKFQQFLIEINDKIKKFSLLFVQWIPESQNKGADNLARQGLMKCLKNRR